MKTEMINKFRLLALSIIGLVITNDLIGQDGEQLFKANCSVCHKTTSSKMVGPGMAGITNKRSKEWLKSWIRDSKSLIASGDADAKAVFTEFNSSPMPGFPQFSDGDLNALIDYLGTLSGEGAVADTTPQVEIVYSDIQIKEGKKYFTGEKSFFNGGPSCISCHNVSDEGVYGGYLAKDLTDAYTRLGEEGIMAMISNPPFPAMNAAYINNPVGSNEQKSIAGYLKSVSSNETKSKTSSVMMFFTMGISGFVVLLVIISIIWRERKKHSVKAQIFARQIKSIN